MCSSWFYHTTQSRSFNKSRRLPKSIARTRSCIVRIVGPPFCPELPKWVPVEKAVCLNLLPHMEMCLLQYWTFQCFWKYIPFWTAHHCSYTQINCNHFAIQRISVERKILWGTMWSGHLYCNSVMYIATCTCTHISHTHHCFTCTMLLSVASQRHPKTEKHTTHRH